METLVPQGLAETRDCTNQSEHECKRVFLQKWSSDQAGHVGEDAVSQCCDEVVHQPELGRLAVDVWRDEEEARLGTEHCVGRQQVLAGAPLRTQHGGGAGGEGGQENEEEEEEERADQRGDDIHGCNTERERLHKSAHKLDIKYPAEDQQ